MKMVALVFVAPLVFTARQSSGPASYTEPAQFYKIIEGSKIGYEITSTPVDHPVVPDRCERRDSLLRVVQSEKGNHFERWSVKADAKEHFERAEKAFNEKRPDDAGREYAAGLAIDPGYGPGWLYSGDIPFGKKQYESALAAYRKAIELDPTNAQAHRFAADALGRLGRLSEAEDEYIRAVARDPGYKEAWDTLESLGRATGFKVERHPFQPPPDSLGQLADNKIQIRIDPKNPNEIGWLAYFSCKAVWRAEPGYRQQHGKSTTDASSYGWTSDEETECVYNYVYGTWNGVEGKLSDEAKKSNPPGKPPTEEQVKALLPDDVRFLLEVMKTGMLWEYVALEELGPRCPRPLALLPSKSFDKFEKYIRQFVIIHTGPVGKGKPG